MGAWNMTSACIGHWLFNENAANSTVTDSNGGAENGILFKPGSAQNTSNVHVAGKVGSGAFLFDGATTSYAIDLNGGANNLRFSNTTPWGFECWVKFTDTAEMDIISNFDNPTGIGWAVEVSSGKIQILIVSALTTNWIQQLSTNTYNDGNYHQLIVDYSGSSTASGLTFTIDGSTASKAAPLADNLTLPITYTNGLPCIASRNNTGGTGQPFNGTLDELVLINRVHTSDELIGRYNGGLGTESLSGTVSSSYMRKTLTPNGTRVGTRQVMGSYGNN